jgi:hypothetical protein
MNTVTPKKKKVKSPKNKATVLENRVKELEEKLSSLEKKKTPLKTYINKVKKFVVKHKYLFIITSSLLFLIISWEGYSLYAYKAASNLTRSAQQQNDFGKAEEELLKMEKITNRSLVLFFLRRESIENRIAYNDQWEKSYSGSSTPTAERTEEEEEEEEEEKEDDSSNSNQEPNTEASSEQTSPKPIPSEPEPEPTPSEPEPEPTPSETYAYHEYYPIILSLKDNKGNVIKRSEFNEYSGFDNYKSRITNTSLKIGDQINLTVEASDPEGRQLFYNFTSNSDWFNEQHGITEGSYKWTTSRNVSHIITADDLQSAGETMRIVCKIKSEKANLRFPGGSLDDSTFLDYTLSPN